MVYIYCNYGNMCTFHLLSFWQKKSKINVPENDMSVHTIRAHFFFNSGVCILGFSGNGYPDTVF